MSPMTEERGVEFQYVMKLSIPTTANQNTMREDLNKDELREEGGGSSVFPGAMQVSPLQTKLSVGQRSVFIFVNKDIIHPQLQFLSVLPGLVWSWCVQRTCSRHSESLQSSPASGGQSQLICSIRQDPGMVGAVTDKLQLSMISTDHQDCKVSRHLLQSGLKFASIVSIAISIVVCFVCYCLLR